MARIGLDNDLVSNKHQAITWTNAATCTLVYILYRVHLTEAKFIEAPFVNFPVKGIIHVVKMPVGYFNQFYIRQVSQLLVSSKYELDIQWVWPW